MALDAPAQPDIQHRPQHAHQQQRPGDHANHHPDQNHKRQVGQGQQVAGREEVAGAGQVTVERQKPRRHTRLRAGPPGGLQQRGKQVAVHALVQHQRQALHLARAQLAHGEFHGHKNQHAAGQAPQRFKHAVVNHLVINQHGIQRQHYQPHIDQQTGRQNTGDTPAQQGKDPNPIGGRLAARGGQPIGQQQPACSVACRACVQHHGGLLSGVCFRLRAQQLPAFLGAALPDLPGAAMGAI